VIGDQGMVVVKDTETFSLGTRSSAVRRQGPHKVLVALYIKLEELAQMIAASRRSWLNQSQALRKHHQSENQRQENDGSEQRVTCRRIRSVES
jgi:hypothetical protein